VSSVFLSHNSKDKPWVGALAAWLIADDVVVWLDEAEINIGVQRHKVSLLTRKSFDPFLSCNICAAPSPVLVGEVLHV